jgi:3-phenylpropionate/trans-cinnamate dioxygenase ferredoxin reductase component
MRPGTVLVVGAGLAGARAAETLRVEGYEGRLIVVGDETSAPYERPALSKEYLAGAKSEQQLRLRPAEFWVDSEIELMLARRVVRIDPALRTATLSSGEVVTWDALVLATGARPRNLPFATPEGVHTLRTLADARTLRASLLAGARLAVVGGGFIGAEVASTAVSLGLDVTLIEALRVPFERTLGPDIGQLLAERYRSHGVELRLATGVVGFRPGADNGVRAARLTDGTEVPCDLALVGIGIEPARELLPHPLAGYPIYPCGDVNGNGGHWTSAAAEGTAVARRILGLPAEPPKPPFFWSDQFGLRLQLVGTASPTGTVTFDGTADSYVARYHDDGGRLVGALAANQPATVAALRRELEQIPPDAAEPGGYSNGRRGPARLLHRPLAAASRTGG